MTKGEKGDRMYISVQGKLAVYTKRKVTNESRPVAILEEFTAVGERALRSENEQRTATVVCLEDTTTLSLDKRTFDKLLGRQIIVAKGFRYTFLVKFLGEIFSEWSKAKILDVNDKYIQNQSMQAERLVYDLG